jgi:hypothetical protein
MHHVLPLLAHVSLNSDTKHIIKEDNMPKSHGDPCLEFMGQSHASVQGSYVDTKLLNPCEVVTCIRTPWTPLSNWLCCDRTCSISMMAITTSNILPQFPPYIPQKDNQLIIHEIYMGHSLVFISVHKVAPKVLNFD